MVRGHWVRTGSLGKPLPSLRPHTPPYKEIPLETLVLATVGVMGSPSRGGWAEHS